MKLLKARRLCRIAATAAFTLAAALGPAAVTWDFQIDTSSDLGAEPAESFSGRGEPFQGDPNNSVIGFSSVAGDAGAGDFALLASGSLNKGANYTYAGVQLWIKNGKAAYNTVNGVNSATTVTLKARIGSASDIAQWGVSIEDTTNNCVDPGYPITLTTSWQTFEIPISGATIERSPNCNGATGPMDLTLVDSVVLRPINLQGFATSPVPINLQVDDIQINGVEGAPVTPQPLTAMVATYDVNTTNSIGGATVRSAGDQFSNHDAAIVPSLVSGEFRLDGSYTSGAGAGWWWSLMYNVLDPNAFYRDISGAWGIRVTAYKFDAADIAKYYIRLEDGISQNHEVKHLPLNLTTTPQTFNIPLTDFTTPGVPIGGYGVNNVPNLAHVGAITIFTEAAANSPALNSSSQLVTTKLAVAHLELLATQPSAVSDWQMY